MASVAEGFGIVNDGGGLHTNHHTQGQQDDECRRLTSQYKTAQNKKENLFRSSLSSGATEDLNCEAVEPIHYSAGRMPEQ